ncbi:hypothetical protein BD289DRAFT_71011 [Coniella lustricola]|uniref:Uncharacterized protein n=1 Tax=Coniella lustricola TaxID=2025994 RepID=A0A2T2ZZV8_9PEZI|nr:hypothetical protein BD289DRAFT_71011 [Coniella lustricola]
MGSDEWTGGRVARSERQEAEPQVRRDLQQRGRLGDGAGWFEDEWLSPTERGGTRKGLADRRRQQVGGPRSQKAREAAGTRDWAAAGSGRELNAGRVCFCLRLPQRWRAWGRPETGRPGAGASERGMRRKGQRVGSADWNAMQMRWRSPRGPCEIVESSCWGWRSAWIGQKLQARGRRGWKQVILPGGGRNDCSPARSKGDGSWINSLCWSRTALALARLVSPPSPPLGLLFGLFSYALCFVGSN